MALGCASKFTVRAKIVSRSGLPGEPKPDRDGRSLDSTGHVELGEDVSDVHADRLLADEEPLADLPVRAALGIVASIAFRSRRRYLRLLAIGLALLVIGATTMVANIDALGGPVSTATPRGTSTGVDNIDLYAVGPEKTILIGAWVTNSSSWPITVKGLPDDQEATAGPVMPSAVAIGMFADPGIIDLREPLPFAPITLQPQESWPLAFLIDTGECAATSDTGNTFEIDDVPIAYEVLGVMKTSSLFLGQPIRIPLVEGCGG